MEDKCRCCLTESRKLQYFSLLTVFPEFTRKSLSVLHLLSTVTSSEVTVSNGLPSKICFECFKSLKTAYSFIIAFEHSQKVLLKSNQQTKNMNVIIQNNDNESPEESLEQILGSDEEKIIIITEENERNNLGSIPEYGDNIAKIDNFEGHMGIESAEPEETVSDAKSIDLSDTDLKEEMDSISEDIFDCDEETSMSGNNDEIEEEDDINMEENTLSFNAELDQETLKVTEIIVEDIKSEQSTSQTEIASSKPKDFTCGLCGNVYKANKNLRIHMRNKHPEITMEQRGKLVEHKTHGEIVIQKCYTCDKVFSSKSALSHHNHNFHHPESHKKYKCNICKKVFESNNATRYHKLAHHGGKNFPCDLCKKRFITPSNLKQHILSVHEKKQPYKYLCSVCGRGFKYPTALKYHMGKEHTKERDFVCGYCGVGFILLGELRTHERNHTGERPFSCKKCGKSFKRSSDWHIHEKTHQGIYPHQCEYCDTDRKVFLSSYNKKVHWLQHRGNYKCELCQKGFASGEILQFHYLYKHKAKSVIIKEDDE